jgi:hypothetical protein
MRPAEVEEAGYRFRERQVMAPIPQAFSAETSVVVNSVDERDLALTLPRAIPNALS